jgi:hypothetical protein
MKTKLMTLLPMAAITLGMTGVAQAQWSDDFESYANTAALSGPYTQIFPAAPFLLDTTKGYLSSQSIHSGVNANDQARMYLNLPGGPMAGSDAAPLVVSFMVDTDVNNWHTREYIEIRSNAGGAYNSGALLELLALGFTSSGVDTTRINQRILSGPDAGWGNLTDAYATRATIADPDNEWTKLAMVIKTSTIEYYVNDNLDTTKSITPGRLYDSIVIGSGLSTAVDVWFDDLQVYVVPEPSTLALGVLGGFAVLFGMRRRK